MVALPGVYLRLSISQPCKNCKLLSHIWFPSLQQKVGNKPVCRTLRDSGFSGDLPTELGLLPSLTVLFVSGSSFTGDIENLQSMLCAIATRDGGNFNFVDILPGNSFTGVITDPCMYDLGLVPTSSFTAGPTVSPVTPGPTMSPVTPAPVTPAPTASPVSLSSSVFPTARYLASIVGLAVYLFTVLD